MTSEEIRRVIDKILNVFRYEIYEKKIFQGGDFERHDKDILENAFNLIKKVKKIDLSVFPNSYLEIIGKPIKEYERLFEEAKAIDEEQEGSGPIEERKRIVDNIRKQYSQMFEAVRVVPIFFKDAEVASDKAIENLKSTFAELAADPKADYYLDTAKGHAKIAKRWLIGGGVIFLLLVSFALYLVVFPLNCEEKSLLELVCEGISRILIIGACIYGLNFCSRIFNNEKHNEVLNHQKHNSLRSFLGLLKATDEDKFSKDQIIHHACTIIFSKNTTGFSKIQEATPISPPEIFKDRNR